MRSRNMGRLLLNPVRNLATGMRFRVPGARMAYTIDSDAEKPPQQKPSGRVQRAWLLGEAAAVAAIPRTKRNQDSKKKKTNNRQKQKSYARPFHSARTLSRPAAGPRRGVASRHVSSSPDWSIARSDFCRQRPHSPLLPQAPQSAAAKTSRAAAVGDSSQFWGASTVLSAFAGVACLEEIEIGVRLWRKTSSRSRHQK